MSTTTVPPRGTAKKPRGLWRAKAQADARRAALAAPPPRPVAAATKGTGGGPDRHPVVSRNNINSSTHNEHDLGISDNDVDEDSDDDDEDGEEIHSEQWSHRTRMLITESIASRPEGLDTTGGNNSNISLDDWEDLKQLFLKAHEHYDTDEFEDALPILRAVIHECHRFLLGMYDPSALFTPSEDSSADNRTTKDSMTPKPYAAEVPTAYHTILGTSLLLFGIIIAQQPLLASQGEVSLPVPYWLAALSAFETADSLPARTQLKSPLDFPHDWRLAVMWGRTLIFLAEELLSRKPQDLDNIESNPHKDNDPFDFDSSFLSPHEESEQYKLDHPAWSEGSIFRIIEGRHPHPSSLNDPTFFPPSELIQQALDHFTRGILHMPHQSRKPDVNDSSSNHHNQNNAQKRQQQHHHNGRVIRAIPLHQFSFSRMRELFNIAASVLIVAEKLDTPTARKTWATHADSLFGQMKVEMLKTSTLLGPGDVEKMRGRCWLVIGSAEAEGIEAELDSKDMVVDGDNDDDDVRDTWHAESARVGLTKGVNLLTKSRSLILDSLSKNTPGGGDTTTTNSSDPSSPEYGSASFQEVSSLLTEALVSLANLTKEEDQRELLYSQAKQIYGGDLFGEEEDVRMSVDS